MNGRFLEEGSIVMTTEQKNWIILMRKRGISYHTISQEIRVSINTVKSFCRRNGMCTSRGNRCIYCGGIITQLPGTKKRVFCSDKCKQTYWNKMRTTRVSKNKLPHQCPVCGEIFYDYSSSKRTYCSQECYHKRNSICTELSD